jgi:hypothetical protein
LIDAVTLGIQATLDSIAPVIESFLDAITLVRHRASAQYEETCTGECDSYENSCFIVVHGPTPLVIEYSLMLLQVITPENRDG